MKTLLVIRHAKSSWDEEGLSDFDRPLNERGKRDAPEMAKRLKEKGINPDIIVSSPAKRAFSTARRMAKVFDYDKDKIKTDRRLYHADSGTIITVLREVKDKHNLVMIFGHNPGLTDFVNSLLSNNSMIDNVPTCGVVAFSLEIDNWKELKTKSGKMLFFDYPKNSGD
jgi:phosphohistidine phosphatase